VCKDEERDDEFGIPKVVYIERQNYICDGKMDRGIIAARKCCHLLLFTSADHCLITSAASDQQPLIGCVALASGWTRC